MSTKPQKVSYIGLSPKIRKQVKHAYRIGLSNGKAIATAGLRRQVELLREGRAIDAEHIATLKKQLAAHEAMPLVTIVQPEAPPVGECIVCEGRPQAPNDPCVACGQMSVGEAERADTPA